MSVLTFELGGLDPSTNNVRLTPEFYSIDGSHAAQSDVIIDFSWNRQTADQDWQTLFQYKSTSDDFSDLQINDVSYNTISGEWFNGNIVGDVPWDINIGNIGGYDGRMTLQAEGTTIAKDLLQSIAYDIFGTLGGLDMFSNEENMLNDISGANVGQAYGDIKREIITLLEKSQTLGLAGDRTTGNYAFHILGDILDASGGNGTGDRRSAALAAFDLSGGKFVGLGEYKTWTITVPSTTITALEGTRVTQGALTGTLNVALTGSAVTEVTILALSESVFAPTTDFSIGGVVLTPTAATSVNTPAWDGWHNVPLIVGDRIVFTLTITPMFGSGAGTPNGHGVGNKTVNPRKYKIRFTLTDE
tara:strand:- start:1783 stop:2859 length:1077 start_codon:yes stop_codon:yes gene_type:complete